MSFYQISPALAKELKAGAFLTAPETLGELGLRIKQGENGDDPTKMWRETFVIRNIEITEEGDEERVRVDLTIPSDVISPNQGRTASAWFHFPWLAAEAKDKKAQKRVSMNYRQLIDLLVSAGYDEDLGGKTLSQIPVDVLRNTRVSAQVKHEVREGILRQDLGYWRAPK